MRDYQQLHLARWQAGSVEDWQTELRVQGYSEGQITAATHRIKHYTDMGFNQLEAREKALDDYNWHSSGQF